MEESCHDVMAQEEVSKPELPKDILPMSHVALFVSSVFVNKYVLSELNFTYPTIFQGWQTLVGALLLHLMIKFGHIHVDLHSITKEKMLPWVPAMFLHVLSIYSGSVALSKMAIPYFVCFQNAVHIFPALVECMRYKQCHLSKRFIPQLMILITCFMLYYTDALHEPRTYMWIALHVLSHGSIILYENNQCHTINLRDVEKIYVNNVFSFVMLAPFSYFLGDAMAAQDFKFWYYYRFYFSCVLSGVFVVFLNLTVVKLKEDCGVVMKMDVGGISKLTTAVMSVFIFPFHLTSINLLWISLNMVSGILLHSFKEHSRSNYQEKGEKAQDSHEI